ncbi:hypothetical protein LZ009_06375 [Ramlibacter sp. XY19]|uniref:hypothetical protein n=1 Tax=Ramlibacter paludis TaxID=2908000 RepID=UPI0023DA0DDF|nr:hypothetical protein [Ramlibacter paludis]MCG2592405.1 hypothetical protein [Ramlibacter paludis]
MDQMHFRRNHLALAAACSLWACAASAEVLRYEFTGTVDSSTYVAQPGEKVTGTFSFDTATAPVGTCFNNTCSYNDPNGTMTMLAGGHQMSASGVGITVQNDQGIPGYEDIVRIGSFSPAVIDGTSYPVGFMTLWMVASKPQVLGSTDAPRDYQVHRFDMVREGGFSTGGVTLQDTLLHFQLDGIKLLQPSQQ